MLWVVIERMGGVRQEEVEGEGGKKCDVIEWGRGYEEKGEGKIKG